jgi:predicted nucleotidyltransferase
MIGKLTGSEREVLEYFVKKPGKIHARGLSQEIDTPYSSVRKALHDLEDKGLLESDTKSKMTFYSPTKERFKAAKKLINLENLEDSGLTAYLDEQLRPETIVLFGSYLEGRDDENSDIDIAIIGGRDKTPDLRQFEDELGRTIQLTTIDDVKEETNEFRNTLANGLVLQGYLEVV